MILITGATGTKGIRNRRMQVASSNFRAPRFDLCWGKGYGSYTSPRRQILKNFVGRSYKDYRHRLEGHDRRYDKRRIQGGPHVVRFSCRSAVGPRHLGRCRQITHRMEPGLNEWRVKNISPRYSAAGLTRFALLFPSGAQIPPMMNLTRRGIPNSRLRRRSTSRRLVDGGLRARWRVMCEFEHSSLACLEHRP